MLISEYFAYIILYGYVIVGFFYIISKVIEYSAHAKSFLPTIGMTNTKIGQTNLLNLDLIFKEAGIIQIEKNSNSFAS